MGMVNTVITLAIAVRVMERATSPLARLVIKLVVAPPGQAASKMNPTASYGSNGNKASKAKVTSGITTSLMPSPTATALG